MEPYQDSQVVAVRPQGCPYRRRPALPDPSYDEPRRRYDDFAFWMLLGLSLVFLVGLVLWAAGVWSDSPAVNAKDAAVVVAGLVATAAAAPSGTTDEESFDEDIDDNRPPVVEELVEDEEGEEEEEDERNDEELVDELEKALADLSPDNQ